jgi:hypothetical protein
MRSHRQPVHPPKREPSLPNSRWALIAWIGIQPWTVWLKVTLFAMVLVLAAGIVGWFVGAQMLIHITSLLG